jgi:cytochrome P450
MMEARLILATVAQQYRFTLVPGHQVEPSRLFTLRPKYGMRMIPTRREPVLQMA